MYIVRDTPPSFTDVAGHVVGSVVPVAVGTRLDGKPNIIGTAFAAEVAETFITCWHVAEMQDSISAIDEGKLLELGLKDKKLRLGVRTEEEDYHWLQQEPKTWFRGADKERDVCVYRIIGVSIPTLHLRSDSRVLMGVEVGIAGFPMGSQLQGVKTRPYLSKTILAGGLEMQTSNGSQTTMIALSTAVAGGFSGGPVFAAKDGQVIGMVASKVMEGHEAVWPAGISLAIPANVLRQVVLGLLDSSTKIIKESLQKTLP